MLSDISLQASSDISTEADIWSSLCWAKMAGKSSINRCFFYGQIWINDDKWVIGNCPLPRLTTGGYPNLASPIIPCPTRYPPSCLFRMELRHQSRSHLCWSLRRLEILADSVLSYAIPSSNQTYLGKLPTDRWFSWFDGTSMENIMGYTISNSWEIPKNGGPKGGKIIAQWGNFPLPCLSIAGQPGFAEYVLRWFPIAWPTRAVCKSKISWDLLGGNKACERRMWWGLSLENLMIGCVQEFGGYPECI